MFSIICRALNGAQAFLTRLLTWLVRIFALNSPFTIDHSPLTIAYTENLYYISAIIRYTMIVKTATLMLRIAFILVISCQMTMGQGGSFQKVDDASKPKLNLTYEYQFTNADSTEGIEKAYKDGKLSVETHFWNKGELQFVKLYSIKTGKLLQSDTVVNFKKMVGSSKAYYANGNIKEIHHRDTSGEVDRYEGFFQNGTRKVIIRYKKGKRNGVMTEYNPNGTVKETGNYVNDKRDGVFKFYDVRGKLLVTRRFKQDKLVK